MSACCSDHFSTVYSQISLTTRQQQILALIRNNPAISRTEMVQKLKINESAIQKHLGSLKKKEV
ncbi:winged helix-turn-helix transcriptional regulator [Mariniphaga sediminis]|uniref:Winged helix-turn-helix transcriptional regulator n=1 Tax=Mariniphaga sediminis TaxID=1628158 RepID=A0A399DC06_9BACT|nr:winged helix-turn-helix transcriptional regulator [Mariniphaga sediminis]